MVLMEQRVLCLNNTCGLLNDCSVMASRSATCSRCFHFGLMAMGGLRVDAE
jgi:hypothetical protein